MSVDNPVASLNVSPADVTVIVPVHNDARNLVRCIEAIQCSTQAAKIVVVDDGSTDDTADVGTASGATVLRLGQCLGPAVARNRGAEIAATSILFFVDADVLIHHDAVERVARTLADDSGIDAVMGSYDTSPGSPNFCSQYKNLFHRYVHQTAAEEASTFWSGCGAVRRDVFFQHGGFSVCYERPCIEDIELGMRMKRAGRRILLDKQLQGQHLKTWTITKLVRSDVFDRAIPWARLIVSQRSAPNDLNLRRAQRLSALLACLAAAVLFIGATRHPLLLLLPPVALGGVAIADFWSSRSGSLALSVPVMSLLMSLLCGGVISVGGPWGIVFATSVALVIALNAHFYVQWIRSRGIGFALLVIPLHLFYFVYSAGSLAFVTVGHALGLDGRAPPPATTPEVSRA